MTTKTGILAAFATVLALAGCGIDGDPVPPSGSTTTPGITVSGDAQVGMRGTL